MISRRTFIGGCVAAGAGAALPGAESGERVSLFGPSLYREITIPAEALIYWSNKSDCAIAVAMMNGREVHVECDVEVRDGRYCIKNTGRIVE
jgi:hypothetical protein